MLHLKCDFENGGMPNIFELTMRNQMLRKQTEKTENHLILMESKSRHYVIKYK